MLLTLFFLGALCIFKPTVIVSMYKMYTACIVNELCELSTKCFAVVLGFLMTWSVHPQLRTSRRAKGVHDKGFTLILSKQKQVIKQAVAAASCVLL